MHDTNLYLCALLVGLGVVVNLLRTLYALEQAGTILNPLTYISRRPYQYALMVASAYMLLAVWYFIGELGYVTSILTGVAADMAYDTLRARAAGRMRADSTDQAGA